MNNDNTWVDFNEIIDKVTTGEMSEYTAKSLLSVGQLSKPSNIRTLKAAVEKGLIVNEHKRNLKVIYICGESGGGKTILARWYCEKHKLSYCISDGGKHLLDSYCGQDVFILDDYRASMPFTDFLRLTDNYNGSKGSARYKNKDMSFCKYIFITSIEAPRAIYKKMCALETGTKCEPYEQLVRRLDNRQYLCVDPENDIYKVMNADDDSFTGKYLELRGENGIMTLITPSMVVAEIKEKSPNTTHSLLGENPNTNKQRSLMHAEPIEQPTETNTNVSQSGRSKSNIKRLLSPTKKTKKD